MHWYVLHVLTGKEKDVGDRLEQLGVRHLIPRCEVTELRKQRYEFVERILFPGYVFIETELSPRLYYSIRDIPSVIRFLGMTAGIPSTVTPREMEPWIILGNGGKTFGISAGMKDKKSGRTRIRSGPLLALEDRIVSVDARQRRAKLELQVMGQVHTVNVGLDFKSSSETTADDTSPCEDQDEQTGSQVS